MNAAILLAHSVYQININPELNQSKIYNTVTQLAFAGRIKKLRLLKLSSGTYNAAQHYVCILCAQSSNTNTVVPKWLLKRIARAYVNNALNWRFK